MQLYVQRFSSEAALMTLHAKRMLCHEIGNQRSEIRRFNAGQPITITRSPLTPGNARIFVSGLSSGRTAGMAPTTATSSHRKIR